MDALITKALKEQKVNFLTVIPHWLLPSRELRFVRWLQDMQGNHHWKPTLEGFTEHFRGFIPRDSDLPIEYLFENEISELQSEYFDDELSKLIDQNRLKNLPELTGIYEFSQEIQKKLSVVSPQIIDMALLDRSQYTNNIKRLSWHIPMLDVATNGWLGSDYMLITGQMNQGKSMVLKTMAMLGYENGENILIVSQELPTLEMAAAMDGFVSGFSPVILRHEDGPEKLKDKLERAQEHMAQNENKLFVAPGIQSVSQLQEYLWMLPEIDKAFVDGINLMGSGNATTSDENYQGLTNTSRRLKRICRDQNVSIFGVTQQNRQGEIGGAYTLLQDPDVVFKVHGSNDRRGRRGIVWENEKNRPNVQAGVHNFFMHVNFNESEVFFYPLKTDDIDDGQVFLGNEGAEIKNVGVKTPKPDLPNEVISTTCDKGVFEETAMETLHRRQDEFIGG